MSSATSGAYTHTHAWDIQASEKENTKSAVNKMWCARRVRWVYRFNGFLWVFLRYINSIKRKPTTTITPLPISRERKRTRLKRKEICVSFSLSEKMKMFLVVIHCNCECQSIYWEKSWFDSRIRSILMCCLLYYSYYSFIWWYATTKVEIEEEGRKKLWYHLTKELSFIKFTICKFE